MPRPRWESLSAERRAPILTAAEAEFAAHGYTDASYNRIIAAAGVSKGAMYYYFDDKEDLFVEVVRRALVPFLRFFELPTDVPDAAAWWDLVADRARGMMAELEGRPELASLARAMYECFRAGAPGGPAARLLAEVDAHVDAVIALGQAAGAVRDDLPRSLLARVTVASLVAMDQWFVERWQALEPAEMRTLAERALTLFRDLLAPPALRADPGGLSLDHRSN